MFGEFYNNVKNMVIWTRWKDREMSTLNYLSFIYWLVNYYRLYDFIIPSQQHWRGQRLRGYSNAAVRGWLGEWVSEWVSGCVCACVCVSVTLYLVDTIATTVFAQSLSNFTCKLWMMRGGTLLILGHGVKG